MNHFKSVCINGAQRITGKPRQAKKQCTGLHWKKKDYDRDWSNMHTEDKWNMDLVTIN